MISEIAPVRGTGRIRIESPRATAAFTLMVPVLFAALVGCMTGLAVYLTTGRFSMNAPPGLWLLSLVLASCPLVFGLSRLMRAQFEAARCIGNLNRKTVEDLAAMSRMQDALWMPVKQTTHFEVRFQRLRAGPVRCDTTDICRASPGQAMDSHFLFATVEGEDVLTAYEALLLDWALQSRPGAGGDLGGGLRAAVTDYMGREILGRRIVGCLLDLGCDGLVQGRVIRDAFIYLVKQSPAGIQVLTPDRHAIATPVDKPPAWFWADMLADGDRIVVVSQNLRDRFDQHHRDGLKALLEITADRPVAEAEATIWDEFRAYTRAMPLDRDATMAILQYRAEPVW